MLSCFYPFLPDTRKRVVANSTDPDQTPHHVASDQGETLHDRIKATK